MAETYARIFFRNSVATGEVFPYESVDRLCEVLKTGDEVTLDYSNDTLTHQGTVYALKPLGEVRPGGGSGRHLRLRAPDRDDPGSGGRLIARVALRAARGNFAE